MVVRLNKRVILKSPSQTKRQVLGLSRIIHVMIKKANKPKCYLSNCFYQIFSSAFGWAKLFQFSPAGRLPRDLYNCLLDAIG